MFTLARLGFAQRLIVGFGLLIIFIISMLIEGIYSRQQYDQNVTQLNLANVGAREVFGLQVLENSYVSTRDPIYAERFNRWHKFNLDNFIASKHLLSDDVYRDYVEKFETANVKYGQEFNQFNQLVLNVYELNQNLIDIEQAWLQSISSAEQTLKVSHLSNMRERVVLTLDDSNMEQWAEASAELKAISDVTTVQYLQKFDALLQLIKQSAESREQMLVFAAEVRDNAKLIVEEVTIQMEQNKNTSMLLGTSVSIIALVVGILTCFVLWRSLTVPLKQTHTLVEKIAGGELFHELKVTGSDELSTLSHSLNRMVSALRSMIGDVRNQVEVLNTTSSNIIAMADSNESSSKQQAIECEQMACAMTQMIATISEISLAVEQVAEDTSSSQSLLETCNQSTLQTIGVTGQLYEAVNHASASIESLAQETHNISSVLEVINSISEQTNLLALNAAIEAARAGEQGRGFAVVADEVRLLAMRTQESTTEIAQIIQTLKDKATETVSVMQTSQGYANESKEQVEAVGEQIQAVLERVNNVTGQTINLSSAVVEQRSTAESFNDSMKVIVDISHNTSDMAKRLRDGTADLSNAQDAINQHVSRFKTIG
ncbi:methyl-accepting chemotaxis protein [Vibrio cionasavignyae]|uniref:methyl-accepting chemotaxis protein n=1 Tax=Vibrio cionasavignyae TaxID=2910252 RepID=UPI003D111D4A